MLKYGSGEGHQEPHLLANTINRYHLCIAYKVNVPLTHNT